MGKKLYRVERGKKISGVCTGVSEYLNVDVTIIRLLWVFISLFTGIIFGLIAYVACVFIIPEEPDYIDGQYREKF